jgi:hypothetical protein
MFADTSQRFGSFEGTRPRTGVIFVVGLAAVLAAWLVAAAPVSAQTPPAGPTVFVHSAKSGQLHGGRLILHGLRGRVTWAHNSGRFGVMTVKRLHRRLFSRGTASATGALHVAGRHVTLRLSRPRHNPARSTVSYRVTRLGKGRLPRQDRAPGAARRFGPVSLSMVASAPDVADCTVTVVNNSGYDLVVLDQPIKDGATAWNPDPPQTGDHVVSGQSVTLGSGSEPCGNQMDLQLASDGHDWFWFRVLTKWYGGYRSDCSQVQGYPARRVTGTGFACTQTTDQDTGKDVWTISPG